MECLDGHLTQTGILDGVENSQHLVAALEVGFSYLRLKQGPRLALSGSRYSVGRQRRIVNNILLQRLGSLTGRSEEHTSELQSRQYLVCRLLLEKKKKNYNDP